uniref:Transmembrane protein n=1 Tax=Fagus sylvatica TaxID=28930 RepID=A0A2N9HXM8_FAGSY
MRPSPAVDVRWASGLEVIPGRVSFDSPTFGVDYSKLFIWKSPYHTRIKWKIRFNLTVVCLARSKVTNLLLFLTLAAVVALEFSGILVTFVPFFVVVVVAVVVLLVLML